MRKYLRLIRYPLREWPLLAWVMAITACSSAVVALQPWPLKLLVDHALGGAAIPAEMNRIIEALSLNATPASLVVIAALASLFLFALSAAFDAGLSWAWSLAAQRMVYDLAADLFGRLQRLSLTFHDRRAVGDYLNRITGDASCIRSVTSGLLIAPAQHGLTLAVVGCFAWSLDPGLTSVLLVVVPAFGTVALIFGRRLTSSSRSKSEARSRLMAFTQQTIAAIPLVQAFGTEERNRADFRALSRDAIAASQRNLLLKEGSSLLNGLAASGVMAVVLLIAGQRVLSGALSVGSLLVFLAYAKTLQGAFRGLVRTFLNLKSAEAEVDRILEILDAQEEVKEAPNAVAPPCGRAGQRGHVRLERVTFGYESGVPVLREVSLEARPGETVALVGPTGAGKSTLVSLIPRFFDPWEGRVLLDGADVRTLKLSGLRAQIGIMLQEPFLFPMSVADNIAYGRPGAGREDIEAAAVAANAESFIRRLPRGYDTVLGERGVTISAGERQRLAIARALLKGAPVLILDEPTSALDTESEALVLEALGHLMEGRTTLIIAHRLSTIRNADRIVALDHGRTREIGTHRDLAGVKDRSGDFRARDIAGGAGGMFR